MNKNLKSQKAAYVLPSWPSWWGVGVWGEGCVVCGGGGVFIERFFGVFLTNDSYSPVPIFVICSKALLWNI